jgi:hypothetical protein
MQDNSELTVENGCHMQHLSLSNRALQMFQLGSQLKIIGSMRGKRGTVIYRVQEVSTDIFLSLNLKQFFCGAILTADSMWTITTAKDFHDL